MPEITWVPEFSVGVASIDTDHKILVNLINELEKAIKVEKAPDQVRRVLDALIDYTCYHFDREEALMIACGYPDADAHIRTHSVLKSQVADIRDRYRRNPDSIHDREVLAFLNNWLTSHIVGRDKRYEPFMEARREDVERAEAIYDGAHATDAHESDGGVPEKMRA